MRDGETDQINEPRMMQSIWSKVVENADSNYQPGVFTTFSGFEWTQHVDGNNLHRVVIFRDGAARTEQVLPFSAHNSVDPEDLWAYRAAYEEKTGGHVFAIAHNVNLLHGLMFDTKTWSGKRLTKACAEMRSRHEPLYYARSALKEGLRQEEKLGANPFKFGMVGSTDAHTGMPTTREDNNFGKLNIVEPSAERFEHFIVKGVKPELSVSERYRRLRPRRGLGLRKHPRIRLGCHEAPGVYATTGSCILVRVFAGWDFTDVEVERPDFAREGYARGVPMRR